MEKNVHCELYHVCHRSRSCYFSIRISDAF